MSRSKWKGPFLNLKQLKQVESVEKQEHSKKIIVINRNFEIVPYFIGSTFSIHNGKNYSEITVTDNMIGHKFGEFSFTRAKFLFKKKKIKK
jgi:small subunit ribosomal protein S19